MTASMNAPLSSRTAFTTCTHVVAIMPPKSTYPSMTTPTMTTATSYSKAKEQADEVAGPHHLRDEVEGDHGERSHGRRHANGCLAQPERDDVGKRVLAEISQRLGDQEHDDRPADKKTDRVDQAVESRERDQSGDAEKARGAHVVAGQREAVLQSCHAAAGRVEVLRAACTPRSDVRDAQRDGYEEEEEDACHIRSRSAWIAAS